ncbi:hypothetical protein BDR07DRAFT_719119 [Suillus spraguei]|nr:hypothetical protein BDR07DRAFT_719119 [Suillus spraguei]
MLIFIVLLTYLCRPTHRAYQSANVTWLKSAHKMHMCISFLVSSDQADIRREIFDYRSDYQKDCVVLHSTSRFPRANIAFHPNRSSWMVNRRQFPCVLRVQPHLTGRQGLTLARTVVDLRTDLLGHGQLYTALSRVRT